MSAPQSMAKETTSNLPDLAESITSAHGKILSVTIIITINIIVCGHLLSYIIGLKNSPSDKHHLTIPIPFICSIKAIGKQVIAGLAAFSISFLIVIILYLDHAKDIFITKLAITNSWWVASQTLASLISVATCIFFSALRLVFDSVRSVIDINSKVRSSDEDILQTLTKDNRQE